MIKHQSSYDKKDCNNLIQEMLDQINEINPTHDTYLSLYTDFTCALQKKRKNIIVHRNIIQHLQNVIEKQKEKHIKIFNKTTPVFI